MTYRVYYDETKSNQVIAICPTKIDEFEIYQHIDISDDEAEPYMLGQKTFYQASVNPETNEMNSLPDLYMNRAFERVSCDYEFMDITLENHHDGGMTVYETIHDDPNKLEKTLKTPYIVVKADMCVYGYQLRDYINSCRYKDGSRGRYKDGKWKIG